MSYSLWTTLKKFGINLPIRASVNLFISSFRPLSSQKKCLQFYDLFLAFEQREHLISFAKVLLCLASVYLFSAFILFIIIVIIIYAYFFFKERLFIYLAIHSFVVHHFTTYQLHVVPCSKTQTPKGAIGKKHYK